MKNIIALFEDFLNFPVNGDPYMALRAHVETSLNDTKDNLAAAILSVADKMGYISDELWDAMAGGDISDGEDVSLFLHLITTSLEDMSPAGMLGKSYGKWRDVIKMYNHDEELRDAVVNAAKRGTSRLKTENDGMVKMQKFVPLLEEYVPLYGPGVSSNPHVNTRERVLIASNGGVDELAAAIIAMANEYGYLKDKNVGDDPESYLRAIASCLQYLDPGTYPGMDSIDAEEYYYWQDIIKRYGHDEELRDAVISLAKN